MAKVWPPEIGLTIQLNLVFIESHFQAASLDCKQITIIRAELRHAKGLAMKMAKWMKVGLLVGMVSILFCGVTMAAETATKGECEAKTKAAAELIQQLGIEGAKPQLQDINGEFVWKDSYVFVIDLENSTNLVHPVTPALVGKPLAGIKDINGKMFFVEFINTAKSAGAGWVDYMWPKPGEKTPSLKKTYVYRVPGQSIATAAGIYE